MSNTTKIIYDGPSLIDGKRIIVLAQVGSRNVKTGAMVQTFILAADVDPITANRTGADFSICGNCPHKGKAQDTGKGLATDRTCYVNLGHGPLIKYKAWRRGVYPTAQGHADIAALGAGRMVRIGTYGDGAAVPSYIWDSLLTDAKGWTAYTHQSGMQGAALDPSRYMTSAENKTDAQKAWIKGERTFRVIPDVADMITGREILCPASVEAGQRTTCLDCGLCAGNSKQAKSIAIVAHGPTARKAKALVAA